MTISLPAYCWNCRHRLEWTTCRAFPAGIPDAVYAGLVEHLDPYPGQVGDYFYEPEERQHARLPLPKKKGKPKPIELGLARLVEAVRKAEDGRVRQGESTGGPEPVDDEEE
jgi:hypothetical protein